MHCDHLPSCRRSAQRMQHAEHWSGVVGESRGRSRIAIRAEGPSVLARDYLEEYQTRCGTPYCVDGADIERRWGVEGGEVCIARLEGRLNPIEPAVVVAIRDAVACERMAGRHPCRDNEGARKQSRHAAPRLALDVVGGEGGGGRRGLGGVDNDAFVAIRLHYADWHGHNAPGELQSRSHGQLLGAASIGGGRGRKPEGWGDALVGARCVVVVDRRNGGCVAKEAVDRQWRSASDMYAHCRPAAGWPRRWGRSEHREARRVDEEHGGQRQLRGRSLTREGCIWEGEAHELRAARCVSLRVGQPDRELTRRLLHVMARRETRLDHRGPTPGPAGIVGVARRGVGEAEIEGHGLVTRIGQSHTPRRIDLIGQRIHQAHVAAGEVCGAQGQGVHGAATARRRRTARRVCAFGAASYHPALAINVHHRHAFHVLGRRRRGRWRKQWRRRRWGRWGRRGRRHQRRRISRKKY